MIDGCNDLLDSVKNFGKLLRIKLLLLDLESL
jgi:hypothetical protein